MVSGSHPFVGSESDNGFTPHLSYTEQFYSHLPFYLSIGMTYEQYWNEDCCLVKYYRQAFELQEKRKNEQCWLQGMYIYEALCDASPVLHAFARKGTKPVPYATEPYAVTEKDMERRKLEQERKKYEQMKTRANSFAIKFNAQMNTPRKGE